MLDGRCVEMGRHYGCTCEFTPNELEIYTLQERVRELEDMLGYLKIPLSRALETIPPLRDIDKPRNVTVTWVTGEDAALRIVERLKVTPKIE